MFKELTHQQTDHQTDIAMPRPIPLAFLKILQDCLWKVTFDTQHITHSPHLKTLTLFLLTT